MITDGNDNASTVSLAQITQSAQQDDIVIYAVGLFSRETPPDRRTVPSITSPSAPAELGVSVDIHPM